MGLLIIKISGRYDHNNKPKIFEKIIACCECGCWPLDNLTAMAANIKDS